MVEIKTSRLLLREYCKSDAERISEIANNKNIAKNMAHTFPHPYNFEDAEKWIKITSEAKKCDKNFVIIFEGEIVGGVGFELKEGHCDGIASGGYWLGEDYWGKGIGTEAWKAAVDYAFENFDIRRIEAGVFSWNPASGKIQEKCGFEKEGCMRNGIIRFGKICDEIKYGMTREDWEMLK